MRRLLVTIVICGLIGWLVGLFSYTVVAIRDHLAFDVADLLWAVFVEGTLYAVVLVFGLSMYAIGSRLLIATLSASETDPS